MHDYRNQYNPARDGFATAIVKVLKDYPDQKLDERFVAFRIGRAQEEVEEYLEALSEINAIERNNGYIWLKTVYLSGNSNPASA